ADEGNYDPSEKVLAKVNNERLLLKDVHALIDEPLSKEDSAAFIKNFVEKWIKKQLLIEKAEEEIDELSEEITSKIKDYRNSLLVYELQKKMLEEQLDTLITEKEIRQFYENNLHIFELKENIFKGIVIKLPKDAPDLDKISKLVQSGKPKDLKELRSYCSRFANYYSIEDSIWLNFDYIVQNSGFAAKGVDNSKILESSRFQTTSDEHFVYFLKVWDYKINNQISPIAYVKDEIKLILLNKRKTKLINDLETALYNKGKENKDFEIFD
ncbi:MAG TPA: peptidyl-prolyl cis-trans isomerase, partial [Cytophagaceae bacterium]